MRSDEIVLVARDGRPTGTADKLTAHAAPGMAHLAFSLAVLRPDGTMLLQRRAVQKHHFRGRWSNSCCSHPRPGESAASAARRRAREELGMEIEGVRAVGSFWYRASDPDSGLVEHEYDTVVTARPAGSMTPDPTEVSEIAWASMAEVRTLCDDEPAAVTPWLSAVLDILEARST